jgi:hypothetical protein
MNMKRLLFIITSFLIAQSLCAQQWQQYSDRKKGQLYADTLYVTTGHNTSGAFVFLGKDSTTGKAGHRNSASISLNQWAAPSASVSLGSQKIVNLADPVDNTDAVNKQSMNQAISDAINGVSYKEAVQYATAAALPANTYNNGTAGVGATLTANANGALSVDGSTPSVGERVQQGQTMVFTRSPR